MSYPWSNKKILDLLKVSGENDRLVFTSNSEKATVNIVDNDIESVNYECNNKTFIIDKKERHHIVVGEENSQRNVYHYLKPGGPAPTIRLGITKHIGEGTWSSLPHDFELNTESGFEEIFFYLLKGASQRAIQRGKGVWHTNESVDGAWLVDNKTFGTVPMGYHPVVGEPGVHVSYIWVYLCKKPEWEKI
jgi:5-deoxy-D-glucuronate isomerase|tara:strand:- start:205 stop:774 length:570 start_codon:yes stop_codon:yes gene_type:complete